jgi:hypothetical protein
LEIDGTAGGFKLRSRAMVDSLTEPEDAGFGASRRLGPKGKPEDATTGESRKSNGGQIRKVDGR